MFKLIRQAALVPIFLAAFSSLGFTQTPAPRIFFTDLTSGPNTGGETVGAYSGAYVTIYGNNFGTSQGSSAITLNGSSCLRVVSWGTSWLWYQKIVAQLGSSCSSGNFSITVNGQTSTSASIPVNGSTINAAAFTVRSGNIYCVSTGGSDSNSGKFPSSCWGTMPKAVHTMVAGDIAYVENGVNASAEDMGYNAAISIMSAGTAGRPIALVAYPGAKPTVNTSQNYGIRTPNVSGPGPYWTIAGITVTVTQGSEALSFLKPNFREVANILSCPNGTGTSACAELESDGTSNGHFVYGNQWKQAGTTGQSAKTYHALYFSLNDNHVDVGWNDIHNVQGCRGIQWYDEGVDMTDIHVHDNLIHDTACDAINLNGVNPNAGTVEVFNNVMYNVGKGPDNPDGAAVYSCVNVESNGNYSSPVQIYNNTCYNAGNSSTANPSQSGGFSLFVPTLLRNNLVYQNNGQPYLTSDGGCPYVATGSSNNAWFGKGSAPGCSTLSKNLNVDPNVVSISTLDFHLQSGSPLVDTGTTISKLTGDNGGITRPQGTAIDIGAYEYFKGSSSVKITCDLNGDGVVDSIDVQIALNQAVGTVVCGSADLQQNGACNVIDVQRVVNASLGQTCRVGP